MRDRVNHPTELRRRAEAISRKTPLVENLAALPPEEIQKAFQDLRVHQIELEMQNEELHRVQLDLDASRRRYFDLYDLAPAGYLSLSDTGLILEVNLTGAAILKMPRGFLINKPLTQFIFRDDQDIYYLNCKQAFDAGEPTVCELRMVRQNRTIVWVHLAISTMEQDDGIIEFRVVMSDITGRKQMEHTSMKQEEQLQLLFKNSSVGKVKADLTTGRYLQVNPAYCQMVGFSEQELLQHSVLDLTHPEDREADIANRKALAEGKIANFQMVKQYIRPNGTTAWGYVTVNPAYDAEGRAVYAMAVIQDITGLKRAEEEREAQVAFLRFINESRGTEELIHAATDFFQKQSGCEAVGIRLKKNNDYPYYETRGFSKQFVLSENQLCAHDEAGHPICDSTGNPVLECMCGNVICSRFDSSKPFFTAKGSFWSNSTSELLASTSEVDRQARTRNRCNGEGYESVALIPLHLGTERLGLLQLNDRHKGQFTQESIIRWELLVDYLAVALAKLRTDEELLVINADLELKVEQRTQELQETQNQFLHAEKLSAIGRLSASIAHEFNNPLQGILSILKGLKKRAILEDDDRELLDGAIVEGDRIKDLIRSLQDFNRPSSGRKVMMDVHQSLDSILLMHKSDFNSRQISVVRNYALGLPIIVAVPDQIKQVFLNLLINAADACPKRGGVITVSTWQKADRVAVAIKDSGFGINPSEMEHIFRPFYTTKPEVKGTGLGLSVSYGIVKSHKGEIQVESQSGEGATFTVLLPIKGEEKHPLEEAII